MVALTWHDAGFDGSNGPVAGAIAVVVVGAAMFSPTRIRTALPQPAAVPTVLGCSWSAIFACVPETSDQMFHVAAMLVVLGGSELLLRATLPWWVHSAATAVVAWAGLYGSTGRPSAIVGALFALWPLVLPAITVMLVPRLALAPAWTTWVIVAFGTSASWMTARSGALGSTVAPAVEDAVLFGLASIAVALPFAAWASRRTEATSDSTDSIAA